MLEERGRGAVLATTHELSALNARLRDAAADAITLTQQAGGEEQPQRRRATSWGPQLSAVRASLGQWPPQAAQVPCQVPSSAFLMHMSPRST